MQRCCNVVCCAAATSCVALQLRAEVDAFMKAFEEAGAAAPPTIACDPPFSRCRSMGGVPACADRALACADERNELQNEERARTHARTHARTNTRARRRNNTRTPRSRAQAAHAEEREEREKEERRHKMDADGFILVERRSKVSTPSD